MTHVCHTLSAVNLNTKFAAIIKGTLQDFKMFLAISRKIFRCLIKYFKRFLVRVFKLFHNIFTTRLEAYFLGASQFLKKSCKKNEFELWVGMVIKNAILLHVPSWYDIAHGEIRSVYKTTTRKDSDVDYRCLFIVCFGL